MADGNVAELRRHFPVLGSCVYMNTGTAGPLPLVVGTRMQEVLENQLHHPRIGGDHFSEVQAVKDSVRKHVAALLGARDTEIALTHNTTEGMNFVTLGVNWTQGDEAVTTNVEHPGALLPLWVVKERYGVTVKTADVLRSPGAASEAVMRHVTSRTKLISLSHVSFSTGDVLPVAEIASAAHERGVLVLVDGAQSFGSIPLDMAALGVDFYAVPGQKWLCGPEGTGALWSRQEVISQLRTTFASYGTMDGYNDTGGMLVKADGRRFEQGTMQVADLAGQATACDFFVGTVGQQFAFERIQRLADSAVSGLSQTPGVEVITSSTDHAGLVSFRVGDHPPESIVQQLADRHILVRSIQRPSAVRLSLGYFNTEDEVEGVITAVGELAKTTVFGGDRPQGR